MSAIMANRENKLKVQFDAIWNDILNTQQKEYYSKMSVKGLVELKKAVSNINNILTLKTTIAFVDFLSNQGIVSKDEACKIKDKIQKRNANANGYDVDYTIEGSGLQIIAEVKCNIPINENSFSTSQINAIIKDLNGLQSGKGKISEKETTDCLRFMVFLNTGDDVHKAVAKLQKKDDMPDFQIWDENIGCKISKGKTYAVFIELNSAERTID